MDNEKLLSLLERIALALEQISLDMEEKGLPPLVVAPSESAHDPRQTVIPLKPGPQAATEEQVASWVCPIHHGAKVVPPGVSRKTGRPYGAFVACSFPGCNEQPPRNVPNHVAGYLP